jgi:hypothetical protein
LQHPVREKDGFYYEARPVKRGDRMLLQLRVLGSLQKGAPPKDAKKYTMLWLEPKLGDSLSVRVLKTASSRRLPDIRQKLEDPESDWEKLFGEGKVFRRLTKDD